MPTKKPTTDRALLSSIHDGLINHPDLAERFDSILKIANEPSADGKIRSADEVESMLIEELRKLGNESLVGWAEGVDHRLGEELKAEDPTVKMREKKL
tara:strand:- start:183 stop:476 length:294 start_codon:yes stop_codon:yes gene_type:complete